MVDDPGLRQPPALLVRLHRRRRPRPVEPGRRTHAELGLDQHDPGAGVPGLGVGREHLGRRRRGRVRAHPQPVGGPAVHHPGLPQSQPPLVRLHRGQRPGPEDPVHRPHAELGLHDPHVHPPVAELGVRRDDLGRRRRGRVRAHPQPVGGPAVHHPGLPQSQPPLVRLHRGQRPGPEDPRDRPHRQLGLHAPARARPGRRAWRTARRPWPAAAGSGSGPPPAGRRSSRPPPRSAAVPAAAGTPAPRPTSGRRRSR